MSARTNALYSYALSKLDNSVVSIDSVDNSNRRNPFACLSCGRSLIPKLGSLKAHHFAHKVELGCNSETYLHNLAKRRFFDVYRYCLDHNQPFYLIFSRHRRCPFAVDVNGDCCSIEEARFDLTKKYNQIFLEHYESGFIPDVLLRHSSEDRCIFVEMAVSHFCEEAKTAFGKPIIEFSIKKESDIDFFDSRQILCSPQSIFDFSFGESFNVKFYNFPLDERGFLATRTEGDFSCSGGQSYFLVYRSGLPFVHHGYPQKPFAAQPIYARCLGPSCDFAQDHYKKTFFDEIRKACEQGIQVKSCSTCKFRRHSYPLSSYSRIYSYKDNVPFYCVKFKFRCAGHRANGCDSFGFATPKEIDEIDQRDIEYHQQKKDECFEWLEKQKAEESLVKASLAKANLERLHRRLEQEMRQKEFDQRQLIEIKRMQQEIYDSGYTFDYDPNCFLSWDEQQSNWDEKQRILETERQEFEARRLALIAKLAGAPIGYQSGCTSSDARTQ